MMISDVYVISYTVTYEEPYMKPYTEVMRYIYFTPDDAEAAALSLEQFSGASTEARKVDIYMYRMAPVDVTHVVDSSQSEPQSMEETQHEHTNEDSSTEDAGEGIGTGETSPAQAKG